MKRQGVKNTMKKVWVLLVFAMFACSSDEECPQGYAFDSSGNCVSIPCLVNPESCEIPVDAASVDGHVSADAASDANQDAKAPVRTCEPDPGPYANDGAQCPESRVCMPELNQCIEEFGTFRSVAQCGSCVADSQCRPGFVCVFPNDNVSFIGPICVPVVAGTESCDAKKMPRFERDVSSLSGFVGSVCLPPIGVSCDALQVFGTKCNPAKPERACGEFPCLMPEKRCTYGCSSQADCALGTSCKERTIDGQGRLVCIPPTNRGNSGS